MARKRESSKKQFKEFVSEKGIFGDHHTDDELKHGHHDEEKTNQEETSPPEKKSFSQVLGKFFREFKDSKSLLFFVLFIGFFEVVLKAVFPWSAKLFIDHILPHKDINLLLWSCGGLAVIALICVAVSIYKDIMTWRFIGNFTVQIKRRLMKHLQKLPLVDLQQLKVGGAISRLQQDTEAMSGLLQHGLLTPFSAFLMLTITLSSLFYLNWRVTLVTLGYSIIVMIIAYVLFNYMRPFQKSLREQNAAISGNLAEVFGGIHVIRSFGTELSENRKYGIDVNLLWRKSLYGRIMTMSVHRSIWATYYFLVISIWLYGGYNTINGNMTVGGLVVFMSFIDWLFRPIFMILGSMSEMQRCMACTERTFDLLDSEPDMVDEDNAADIKKFQKSIKFEDVTFEYPDGNEALSNINLEIEKGKVTALVGPSGGGKSTLTNLVLRFYDVTKGKITIDDKDIRDLKLNSYRALTSLVLQDIFLFDGTIYENISYGKADATIAQIKKAAKVANCHDFIMEFKKKYETVIGERGVKLSGGQKQRIALARAILVNPQLLILDEATSNLDSESEALIQEALETILKSRTTLVIAHRLSTIMDADKIIVMDQGEVFEEGNHNQLIKKRGRYYELYTKQMEKSQIMQNYWNENA